jgi:ATP-dependent Clp protease ATP-binding subunit ClpA
MGCHLSAVIAASEVLRRADADVVHPMQPSVMALVFGPSGEGWW